MFKQILNTFGTRSVSAVINLLIAIVLSQFLGAEGKGQQGLIITTITFILVFANLVGGATLVYFTPRHKHSLLLLPSYIWTLIISLVSFALLYFFNIVQKDFIIHICLLAGINSYTAINSSMLIGKQKIASANAIALVQPVITIVSLLVLFMVFDKIDVFSYIISLYIAFGASFLVSYIYLIRFLGKIRLHTATEYLAVINKMFRFGFLNQVGHITQLLSFRLSYYFLDYYQGEAAVGIYSNGVSLAESIWLVSKSISMVQYARIANTRDEKYASELTIKLIKAALIVSFLFLLPLIFLPVSVYTFVFGPEFGQVREVIWSLSAGVLIYNIAILLGHYFSGLGRYHINAYASITGLGVSIPAYFLLIPAYGVIGAGIGASISYFVTMMVLIVFFRRGEGAKGLRDGETEGLRDGETKGLRDGRAKGRNEEDV